MASIADKNLSQAAQKEINDITAKAQSGQISWTDANKQANAVRAREGANYTVSSKGTTTYDDGSTISSYKSGSTTSGGKAKQTIGQNAGSGVYGVIDIGGKTGPGDAVKGTRPNTAMRKDLAGQTVQSGNWIIQYDEDGYAHVQGKGNISYSPHQDLYVKNNSYSGGNLWTDEEMLTATDLAKIQNIRNQMNAGTITGDQANALANQIRSGYGYTIDKQGNVTDLAALSIVNANRLKYGLYTNPTSEAEQNYLNLMFPEQSGNTDALLNSMYALNQGTYYPQNSGTTTGTGMELGGYSSFEEFMEAMGYDAYASQTQAAIQASVQNAINQYNQQIQDTSDETEELARQAYIAKMLGQKNLDQQLAANGYAGGMADSQRIATETNYQNQLNDLEMQKAATIRELQNAITSAQLSGDMQTAQELASYMQQVQSQWNSYVMNQQAMANQNYWNQVELDNQNYWNQQSLNAQNQETAYAQVMSLLQNGYTPSAELLAAAGLSGSNLGLTGVAETAKLAAPATQQVRTASGGNTSGGNTGGGVAQGQTGGQAAGNSGMNAAYFNAFASSLAAQLSAGKNEAAQSNLEARWGQLNDTQKAQILELTGKFGY